MERKIKLKKKLFAFIVNMIVFSPLVLMSQSRENMIVKIDSVYSKSLNEYRKYFIYIPSNLERDISKCNIIYATDGQEILNEEYIPILDSLIKKQIVSPTILVGVFSNEKVIGHNFSQRQIEYVKNENRIYKDHKSFFINELKSYILNKYSLNKKIDKTLFYGFSNGAAFGFDIFFNESKNFDYFICFSPLGVKNDEIVNFQRNNSKKLFMAYGKNEIFLALDEYKKLSELLKKNKFNYEETVYHGGHDRKIWKKLFFQILSTNNF